MKKKTTRKTSPKTSKKKPAARAKPRAPDARPQRKQAASRATRAARELRRAEGLDKRQLNVEVGDERMSTVGENDAASSRAFPIEIDPKRIEASLSKIRGELMHWANKGRYTKVRFKFRGRQLLPDLPLAAVAAVEGLSFYWAGILRAVLMTVGAGALLDVELVNDSEKKIAEGKAALLSGDSDKALELFQRAVQMERDNPNAHLNIGIVSKLRGDRARARAAFEKAKSLDPEGPIGADAERLLATVAPDPAPSTPPAQITFFPPQS